MRCNNGIRIVAQDHRNDVFSNSIAIVAAFLANWHSSLWFLDPAGAIAISIYIAVSWLETGKEQVERLIGLRKNAVAYYLHLSPPVC